MYWNSETGKAYGCSRFLVAPACPVNQLKNLVATQYELQCNDNVYSSTILNAMALCPDPSVRIEALGMDPIETLARHRAHDALAGTNRTNEIMTAIANIVIGDTGN